MPRSRGDGIEQPKIGTPVFQKEGRAGILDDTSRLQDDHPPNAE